MRSSKTRMCLAIQGRLENQSKNRREKKEEIRKAGVQVNPKLSSEAMR